jgi:hypothetical protein
LKILMVNTDEYGQMAVAYYLEELRKEELKNVV